MENPYPEFIKDETSGIQVKNEKHILWQEGYEARRMDSGDHPLELAEMVSGSTHATIHIYDLPGDIPGLL